MTVPEIYEIFLKYPAVLTDSRKITPGGFFFALKGENFDGNRFAASALEAGASFAVVDSPAVAKDKRFILVKNVLETLQQLAAFHREELGLPVIAITGTNGKTTTKELVAAVLSKKYQVEYTRGNLNNHIGVPLTLLSMTAETDIGIVEMGANHPGEIDFLCRIARPGYGLITNVGKAHLEGFGSFEGVVRTKSELYRFLEEQNGLVFVNGGNEILLGSAGNILKKVRYGTAKDNYQRGEVAGSIPFLQVKAWFRDQELLIPTHLVGDYNLENVLAATAVGRYFGVEPSLIRDAIESYTPSNNRSQYMKAGSNEIIMDAYNANPSSMQASIANFLTLPQPGKLIILGDMLELGDAAAGEHQQIINYLSTSVQHGVLLCGPIFHNTSLPPGFLSFPDRAALMDYLRANPPVENLILIKGSRGMQLEKLIELFN